MVFYSFERVREEAEVFAADLVVELCRLVDPSLREDVVPRVGVQYLL